jgi:hypothetical protein
LDTAASLPSRGLFSFDIIVLTSPSLLFLGGIASCLASHGQSTKYQP